MAASRGKLIRVSYNFAFWSGADDLDPGHVYRQLSDERAVAGVDVMDRNLVLAAIADHLAGWRWDGQILQPPGTDRPRTAYARMLVCGKHLIPSPLGARGPH